MNTEPKLAQVFTKILMGFFWPEFIFDRTFLRVLKESRYNKIAATSTESIR